LNLKSIHNTKQYIYYFACFNTLRNYVPHFTQNAKSEKNKWIKLTTKANTITNERRKDLIE